MSSVDAPRRAPVAPSETALVCGWGRTNPAEVTLVRPGDAGAVASVLGGTAPPRGLIPRGAGRSYGDAAQNGGGVVLDMSALRGVVGIDSRSGDVRVRAGTRFSELLGELAAHGLTLPVVPGTAHLSVGGAIAADVHGKNHPRDGSLGMQLRAFELVTPADGAVEVWPEEEPELFAATLGGMGLTGAITTATLSTILLRRPLQLADVDRVDTLEQALELIDSPSYGHAIAWVDLMAHGRGFARAVVTRSRDGDAAAGASDLALADERRGLLARLPGGILRPATARAFNRAYWLRSRPSRERPLAAGSALFPLDALGGWNRLYGRHGLVQYQFAVPDGKEWMLRCLAEMLRARHVPMYLATVKRFGEGSCGMLSFPLRGWTLAIDIPAQAPHLSEALARADAMVAAAGGRVYLAKDSRLPPELVPVMYPELDRLRELRARLDPSGVLQSDLARRLQLL
jgi:decaprenylphospho-beta-D-ribofuranose 2-oxidase